MKQELEIIRTICPNPNCKEYKDPRSKRCMGCYGKNRRGKLSNLKNKEIIFNI